MANLTEKVIRQVEVSYLFYYKAILNIKNS